jgi:hypothetical protein
MSPRQPREKRSIWESVGAPIGVISAAVGLLIALVGLPHTVASALGRSESAVSSVDLTQKRAALAAAGPRLEARYVFLRSDIALNTTDLALKSGSDSAKRKQPAAVTSVLSLPTVAPRSATEVMGQLRAIDERGIANNGRGGCRLGKVANISVAFLVITNRGRRDASNVAVRLERLRLAGQVRISEGPAHPDDYVAKLHRQATSSMPVTEQIPITLGPGVGVRLPLLVSDAPPNRFDLWCVVSRTALLPRSLRFDDPILGTATRNEVRRMQTPTLIAPGAYARG